MPPRHAHAAHVERLEHRRLLTGDVVGLTLVDADTDLPIMPLLHGTTIDLAVVGRRLNVVAEVSDNAAVDSVRFNYDANPIARTENAAPYALGGDDAGDLRAWTPTLGTRTLVVTPYDLPDLKGNRGGAATVVFNVIDTSALPAPIRINAGGPGYTRPGGDAFLGDRNFAGTTGTATTVFDVANTTADPLYHTRRYGANFTFNHNVPSGVYALTLHFAEPHYGAPGRRTFDVRAEGKLILDNYDIVAAVGPRAAVARTFDLTITDGQANLAFTGVVNHAMVNAIELRMVSRNMTQGPVYIEAGGATDAVDSLGRRFERGNRWFTGGSARSATYDVLGTDDDAIFQTYHAGGAFSFRRPVGNGNYFLWLEFADPSSTAPGQRRFDAWAEGAQVLNDFDVVAAAQAWAPVSFNFVTQQMVRASGAQRAVGQSFRVTVTDGALDLKFAGVLGEAIVSAVVLIPADVAKDMLWYSNATSTSNPDVERHRETARQVQSGANLRSISQSLYAYANDHKGYLPTDFSTLLKDRFAYADARVFASPRVPTATPQGITSRVEDVAWVATLSDYVFVGGGKKITSEDGPMLQGQVVDAYENPNRVPGAELNVLFRDGHIEAIPRADVVAVFGGMPVGPTFKPLAVDPPVPVDRQKVLDSASKLRTIGHGMFTYANNYRGYFPPSLSSLYGHEVPQYPSGTVPITAATFVNPRWVTTVPAGMTADQQRAWIDASTDYLYLAPSARASSVSDEVIVVENPAEMRLAINVLFGDGRAEFVPMRWALELMAAARRV